MLYVIYTYAHAYAHAHAHTSYLQCKASGGRFRGKLGRVLFQTDGLFQSILPPASENSDPIATNKVAFRLFGCMPGFVGLRGRVEPVGDNDDTCKVRGLSCQRWVTAGTKVDS